MYTIDYDEMRLCWGDPYLRLYDIMNILHISYKEARNLIDNEGLRAYKCGGRWHVHKADLVAWCNQKNSNPRRKHFKLPTRDPYFGY